VVHDVFHLLAPFVLELLIVRGRHALAGSLSIDARTSLIGGIPIASHQGIVGTGLGFRGHERCVGTIGSGSPAHPQFGHAGLDLGVIGADETAQGRADLAIGFFEATAMGIAIELFPLVGEASGPFLASLGFAMDFLGNRIPGTADGAHFGGGGEQSGHVVAHGELPLKGRGVRGEDRFVGNALRGVPGSGRRMLSTMDQSVWAVVRWRNATEGIPYGFAAPFTGLSAERSRPALEGG